MGYLAPVNPIEKRTAEVVQQTANQTINYALNELRKADATRAIANQLLELMAQELREYREGSEAWTEMGDALANLNKAERLIRVRGEANGHR